MHKATCYRMLYLSKFQIVSHVRKFETKNLSDRVQCTTHDNCEDFNYVNYVACVQMCHGSDIIYYHQSLVVISFVNDFLMRLIRFMYDSTLVIYFCIKLSYA